MVLPLILGGLAIAGSAFGAGTYLTARTAQPTIVAQPGSTVYTPQQNSIIPSLAGGIGTGAILLIALLVFGNKR